jgi:hypothetical protein
VPRIARCTHHVVLATPGAQGERISFVLVVLGKRLGELERARSWVITQSGFLTLAPGPAVQLTLGIPNTCLFLAHAQRVYNVNDLY